MDHNRVRDGDDYWDLATRDDYSWSDFEVQCNRIIKCQAGEEEHEMTLKIQEWYFEGKWGN